MKTRKWEPRELRMLTEWLIKKYPRDRVFTHVRVGADHPILEPEKLLPEERQLLKVYRRWVDAIVVTKTELLVIEAAILPDPGDISKLQLYVYLVSRTRELSPYLGRKIIPVLLYAIPDPATLEIAQAAGIRLEFYHPPWIDDYLITLARRKTRGSLTHPLKR